MPLTNKTVIVTGRAPEIADAVAYLASDASSFPTGVNLDINGGLLMS